MAVVDFHCRYNQLELEDPLPRFDDELAELAEIVESLPLNVRHINDETRTISSIINEEEEYSVDSFVSTYLAMEKQAFAVLKTQFNRDRLIGSLIDILHGTSREEFYFIVHCNIRVLIGSSEQQRRRLVRFRVQLFELSGERTIVEKIVDNFGGSIIMGIYDLPYNSVDSLDNGFRQLFERIDLDHVHGFTRTFSVMTSLSILVSHPQLRSIAGEEYTLRFGEIYNSLFKDVNVAAIVVKERESGEDMIRLVFMQYINILARMKMVLTCLRYKTCSDGEKSCLHRRLLDGLHVVLLHFVYGHSVRTAVQLQEIFHNDTVIFHGSYFFGDNAINPKDMDLIIMSSLCTCETLKLPSGLHRPVQEDEARIGHECSELDISLGITISDTICRRGTAKRLYSRVKDNLVEYVEKTLEQRKMEKQFRYITNIAVVLVYLLSKACGQLKSEIVNKSDRYNKIMRGIKTSIEELVPMIKDANKWLQKGRRVDYDQSTNENFKRLCNKAHKSLEVALDYKEETNSIEELADEN